MARRNLVPGPPLADTARRISSQHDEETDVPKIHRKLDRQSHEECGARIAALRKARGITQVELALKLGITPGGLSKYENGELRLHSDLLVKLAKILGASIDDIFGVHAAQAPAHLPKDRRFLRRIPQIERLPKRDQDALLRTIDAFIASRKAS
jgi:transcriptional regulator with XRE-family HTH domain